MDHRRPLEPIKGCREVKSTPPRESGAGGGIQTTDNSANPPALAAKQLNLENLTQGRLPHATIISISLE